MASQFTHVISLQLEIISSIYKWPQLRKVIVLAAGVRVTVCTGCLWALGGDRHEREGEQLPDSCHHNDLRPVLWAIFGQHSTLEVRSQLTLGSP